MPFLTSELVYVEKETFQFFMTKFRLKPHLLLMIAKPTQIFSLKQ